MCFQKQFASPVLGWKSSKNVGFKAHWIISLPWAENYEHTQGAHTWAGSAWRKSEQCENDTEKYFWAMIYNCFIETLACRFKKEIGVQYCDGDQNHWC